MHTAARPVKVSLVALLSTRVALAEMATKLEDASAHGEALYAVRPPRGAMHVDPRFVAKAAPGYVSTEPTTYFHSLEVPKLSLESLIRELLRRCPALEPEAIPLAFVLIERYTRHTGIHVTRRMMHRMLVAACLVTAKAHQDRFPSNSAVAYASGLPLLEVNRLESAFLVGIDWLPIVRAADLARCDFMPTLTFRTPLQCGGDDQQLSVEGPAVEPASADTSLETEDAFLCEPDTAYLATH